MKRPNASELKDLREHLYNLHLKLVQSGLAVWTAGNVSARVPDCNYFLIKPSGVLYEHLTPESMVLCDLDGQPADDAGLSPSSDTASHAYVYREMPEVNGVVHTHSPFACAFAAAHEPIPCVLTNIANEFGGEIPLGPLALIGDESIGRGIVETLRGHHSPAVLMRSHGVFTIGHDATSAVKAAVMCEDSARAVLYSRVLGTPVPLEESAIGKMHYHYHNIYGQR